MWTLPVLALLTGFIVAMEVREATAAAEDRRQTLEARLTTVLPDTPTGSGVRTSFVDPANRVGKPYALDRLIIESGLQFDQRAVPRCAASDAELLARGEAACPRESVVQRGRIVLDTGSPLVVPRLIGLRTTTFNAPGGYLHLGEGDTFPMRGTARSTVKGGVVEIDYADAPGWGGPDRWAAMTFMESFGPAIVRDRRAFLRTPRTCPSTRRWIMHYTFVYHDGVRQRETTAARCRPQRVRRRS